MLKTLRNWIQNRRKKQLLPIDWFLDEPEFQRTFTATE